MLLIGGLIVYSPFGNDPQALVGSIYDDALPAGVPFLFSNSITFFSMQYAFTMSLQLTVIFAIIGMLLIENFRLIIQEAGRLKNGNKGYSKYSGISYAFAALSCQCEATTSLLPAIGSEILGIASLPLVLESLFLTFFTFLVLIFTRKGYTLKFFEKVGKINVKNIYFVLITLALIVGEPLFLSIGLLLGYRDNLLFYSSVNVIMFIAGLLVVFLFYTFLNLKASRRTYYIIVVSILSVILMFIWYIPYFVNFSLQSGLNYSIMAGASIVSGLLAGIAISNAGSKERLVVLEYIGGMLPVVSIIILYFTAILSIVIWPQFGIIQQLYFSIIFLGTSLPVMWLFTNYSIYRFSKPEDVK
ncbi:MAG: hypothetical protein ACYDBI_04205 [Thermoplasmataceae archaeon]